MGVSAIIVTYRTGAVLFECLAAASAEPIIRERIIIDNGNPPEVVARLADEGTLIGGQGNIGFAAACNLGAARAREEVLLFLNPDAVVEPGALAFLLETLAAAPAPAIVGGRLIDSAGEEQRGARRDRLTLWSAFVSFTGLAALERASVLFRGIDRSRDPLPERAITVGAVSGAFMAIRRTDFDALGGFDAGYFLHVEDLDLCRRCEAAGGVVMFEPRARVRHIGAASAAAPSFIARCKARGFARYFRKHARGPVARIAAALLAPMLLIILPLRAAFQRRR